MSNIIKHTASIKSIIDAIGWFCDSGTEYVSGLHEVASELPDEPFSPAELDELIARHDSDYEMTSLSIIFSRAGHSEILPWLSKYFDQMTDGNEKLSIAAAMAQLGDEVGYEFIEDVFHKYMHNEDLMKDINMESFVYVFEEILTNDRGKEMIARFRKEANYDVVCEMVEIPS